MTTVDSLSARYSEVKQRIAAAARASGRIPADVLLVAVSKYAGLDEVRELVALGHTDFGESDALTLQQRVDMIAEWQQRRRGLPGAPIDSAPAAVPVRWHMIGHLQRAKVRKAIELARLIHSVDSLRVAEDLQAAAMKLDRTADVLIQVNASGEGSKFGVMLPAALHLAEQMDSMVNLRLRGLMTLAPHGEQGEDARTTFARTRELYEEMRRIGVVSPAFNILSMGMSGDFEVAISEGANIVRLGSTIFGPREPEPEPDIADDDGE
ncbi:YggS family pyridoxal phosphate-dependent enzyme [soil metagenome]